MIDTVIFDLDGLLIDSERSFYELDKRFLDRFKVPFSLDDYVTYHCGKTVNDNIKLFISKYGLPITFDEALAIINEEIKKDTERGIPLKEGALNLLMYLKERNYKIALATSSVKDRALTLLDKDGVTSYFDAFVFGGDVKRGKPSPDVFIKAQERLGSDPSDCLVLEDSEAGIMAAHAAKMSVICVPDLKMPCADIKKLTIKICPDLFAVIDHLKSIQKDA